MNLLEVIGALAGFLTTFGFEPQVIKTRRMHSARDFSWPTLLMFCAGLALWLA